MLTVKGLRRWKPKPGKRPEKWDGTVPGLCARASAAGEKSLYEIYWYRGRRRRFFICRFDLVDKGVMPMGEVRAKALEVWNQARQGRDTAGEQKAARATAKVVAQTSTFAQVFESYGRRKLEGMRSGHAVKLAIEKHIIPHWRDRPIASITAGDVVTLVEALIDAGITGTARKVFESGRAVFAWAIGRPDIDIKESPFDRLRPQDIFGKHKHRDRILTDDEWRALLTALPAVGFPFGPIVEILSRTGMRRSECAEAELSEIDFAAGTWTIPAARMKAEAAFVVPIVPEVAAILKGLPRLNDRLVFPNARGTGPVSGFSAMKARLDREMAKQFGTAVPSWSLHDLRRSARTHWSTLPIPGGDLTRELMLAHTKPELHKVYDQHKYLAEHREGLQLWQARLAAILENRTAEVISLNSRTA